MNLPCSLSGLFKLTSSGLAVGQIKDLGTGNFGIARLMQDRMTGELVAVKFLERGDKVG